MDISKRNIISNRFWEYLLFLLWPSIAFIAYIRNFGNQYSNAILILFYGLFGYTFVYDESADSYNHAADFLATVNIPFSDFFDRLSNLYLIGDSKPDFLLDFINFAISRITDDTKIFFMTLSILIGWMLMKNLNIFQKLYLENRNIMTFVFLLFFFILIPPSRILSFRHYFALLVYVFGVYLYLKEGKIIYLIVLASSIFIHFGFLIVVGLFFIYKFAGNRNTIYYILIALSFLFYEQAASLLREFGIIGFEIGLSETISGYTDERYLQTVSELQMNRMVVVNSYIRWTTLFMIASLIFHKLKYKKFDKISENIYSFSLLIFAFVNFTQGMEAMTNRFGVVFQVIACVFFIHLYALNIIRTNVFFKYSSIIFICLNLIILMRITIEYSNMLLVTPFLPLSFFVNSDYSILQLFN